MTWVVTWPPLHTEHQSPPPSLKATPKRVLLGRVQDSYPAPRAWEQSAPGPLGAHRTGTTMLRLRSMTVSSKTGNYSSVSKGGATVIYLRVYLYLRIS